MDGTQPRDTDHSRLEQFFVEESLDSDPTLLGSKCTDCGEVHFPARDRCPDCFGGTEDRPLSRTGTLYSYTTVEMGPTGFDTPYSVGYVDLPEGIRIFATIPEDDDLELGREMAVTTGTVLVADGVAVEGYQFVPVEGST